MPLVSLCEKTQFCEVLLLFISVTVATEKQCMLGDRKCMFHVANFENSWQLLD